MKLSLIHIYTLTVVQVGGREKNTDEQRILYEIAVALDWENWSPAFKNSWTFAHPLEEWYGVTVREGKVVGLSFPSDATGAIPEIIGDLRCV